MKLINFLNEILINIIFNIFLNSDLIKVMLVLYRFKILIESL